MSRKLLVLFLVLLLAVMALAACGGAKETAAPT